jgi:N-acetyl-alpha-D-glucosaminyl L-malate synthase BshA
LRIVILVSSFPPKKLGGTEIATYSIAKYLARRGHEVHVITSWDEGLPKESFEEGFYVHRIRVPRLKIGGYTLHVLREPLLIKELSPDIVHAQSIPRGTACVLARKLFGIPCVVWGQGSDVYLPWIFKKVISKFVLGNADALIALTEHMKQKMIELFGRERCDIFVIPNGIDYEFFSSYLEKQSSVASEPKGNRKVVLYIGRLEPVKGVRYLVQAMGILRDRGLRNAKLLIVGDGSEKKYLEELVKKLGLEDYVVFAGKVPHEKIPEYMALADVFVLPSLSEGFPLVVVEAMAMGLPVIASRVRGLPWIIRNGQNGFLVEPCNPRDIAEKIILLLTNDYLRAYMSKRNIEEARKYSWEKIIEKLEKVYTYVTRRNHTQIEGEI